MVISLTNEAKPGHHNYGESPAFGTRQNSTASVLSESQCVELAQCFLQDTVLKASKITENVIVAFTPDDGRNEIEKLLPENIVLTEQQGNNLGERMQGAFQFAENKEFSPIVMIGTDSPTLPPDFIRQAFLSFENERTKTILGGTRDGGYYLIGLRQWADGLFENVEWSSENTFRQTAENAQKIFGSEITQLPVWYDVDTPFDLHFLIREFAADNESILFAPQTAEYISALNLNELSDSK